MSGARSAVYLDAQVLACPGPEAGFARFSDYVENLLSWRDLRDVNWIDIHISRYASYALASADAYPPYADIQKAIVALGVVHLQARDLVQLINGFLTRSSIVEDCLGLDDILFDSWHTEPEIRLEDRKPSLREHFMLLCVLMSLHREIEGTITDQVLITTMSGTHTGSLSTSATVVEMKKNSATIIPDTLALPFTAACQFCLVRDLHSLYMNLEPCSVLAFGRGEVAFRRSMEIFVYQSQPRVRPYRSPIDHRSFSVCPHFLESCRDLGFLTDAKKIRMLLRACSETVLGTNTRDTHWIRKSGGGNAEQLVTGDRAAWRRDVDAEFHLHYWVTPRGPRLAKLVAHNDYSIPNE